MQPISQGIIKVDPLAQSVEHNTFNVGVLGSSPKRITKKGGVFDPFFVCLDNMQPEENHQTIHQNPEHGERQGLPHDIAILSLHVASCRSNGY